MGIRKQQLKPCVEQLIGSELRKEYDRAICSHPVYLILCAEHSLRNARLHELQVGIKSDCGEKQQPLICM